MADNVVMLNVVAPLEVRTFKRILLICTFGFISRSNFFQVESLGQLNEDFSPSFVVTKSYWLILKSKVDSL
jgi:hypothetical protein